MTTTTTVPDIESNDHAGIDDEKINRKDTLLDQSIEEELQYKSPYLPTPPMCLVPPVKYLSSDGEKAITDVAGDTIGYELKGSMKPQVSGITVPLRLRGGCFWPIPPIP